MEFMTNLQGGLDELKPSLFEILSEQQLLALLPPSLRYLLAVATHRHPRYLIRILNNFDEVYAVLALLVERHFLRTYGGSFTENFYGLKRERVLRVKAGEIPRAQLRAAGQVRETLRLRNSDVWKNLAIMVGLPYIKRKLDEAYDVHAAHANILGPQWQDREELSPTATFKQRFMYYYKWFLRKVYPSVNAAYYFAILSFNLAYLFDTTRYSSPFLWLIGTRIRRMGEADYQAIDVASRPKAPGAGTNRPGQTTSIFNPRIMVRTIAPKLLSSLRILLPTSIFALKFLEWWHASDFARQLSRKTSEGLELPPPVISGLAALGVKARALAAPEAKTKSVAHADTDTKSGDVPGTSRSSDKSLISISSGLPILTVGPPTPETSHLCPICGDEINNPTATPYGYVYCYTCIHKWVQGDHDRQTAFMEGNASLHKDTEDVEDGAEGWGVEEGSREGRWESGKGRCAVTGKIILGGAEVLRRVLV